MKKFISYPAKQKSLLISFCFSLFFMSYFVSNGQTILKTWKGTTDQQWSLPSNWDSNSIPTNSDDVIIPNVSNKPIISNINAECHSLTIHPLASLTLSTGGNLKISGNFTNNGTFVPGISTATFNGSSGIQSISGDTNFYNLTLDNAKATTNFGSSETTIAGRFSKTAGDMNPGSGTIKFSGTAASITGGGAKIFYNLQINDGAIVSNSTGGNLTINNDFTNNGIFRQEESLTTFFRGDDVIHNLIGGGSTSFGNVNIEGKNTVNAGTHNFTVTDSELKIYGTFNGDQANVTLKGSSSISGSGSINFYNLTLSGIDKKTIAPSTEVTVNGILTTNDVLVINSSEDYSGSLIVNGSSSGKVTYNRWFNHTNTKKTLPVSPGYSRWDIASSPVAASGFNNSDNTSKIHMDGSLYDFATYSTAVNDWDYVSTIPGDLDPGKGYLISFKPEKDGILEFSGALNGDLTDVTSAKVPVVNDGWNALGNPYTSAISAAFASSTSIKNFLTENFGILKSQYAAIYVWNEPTTSVYDGNQQCYRIIGNSGYSPIPSGISVLSDKAIQAGQGFLIYVNANTETQYAKFYKGVAGMQFHKKELTLKSTETSWPGITLLAESKGQIRSTVVAFNENMTTGLDVSYDAGLLASDDFQVYTHLADGSSTVDFAVQCLPDMQTNNLRIPLGVDLPDGGELVFKASGIILPDGMDVVLEDLVTGTKTKLKNETDTYKVTLSKNTSGIGRFYLSIAGQAITNAAFERTTNYTASFVNNRITIYGDIEPGTKAILFDLNGRKVGEYPLENINRNEISISGLTQTIFILKIVGRYSSQAMKLIHVKN